MALPLDPELAGGLFPDLFVAPFIAAPAVEALADEVIGSFDEFEPIQTALREKAIAIGYVFETKPFDPDKEEYKSHTVAKVNKASPLWRCLTALELVIQFRQAFWDVFDDAQRRAVLHHELTHIEVDEPDEQGRTALRLRPHDVEDFTKTMRRFGPIIPGRAAFVKAFLDWQHEQDRPEPTKLRPVTEIAADVLEMSPKAQAAVRAAIDLKRAAADAGVDITVDDAEQAFRDDEGGPA